MMVFAHCVLQTSIEIDAWNNEVSTGQLKKHCGGLQMFTKYIFSVLLYLGPVQGLKHVANLKTSTSWQRYFY